MNRKLQIILFILLASLYHSAKGQDNYDIKAIDFYGNEMISSETLRARINIRSATFLEKVAFWKEQPKFSPVMLDNDLERLRQFYQRNGFLKPSLEYSLERNKKREKLRIKIEVEEGEAVKIDNITFTQPNDSAAASLLSGITGELPLNSGDRFSDQRILELESMIKNVFQNNGYPLIEVTRNVNVYPDKKLADIRFNVKPGPRTVFGKVQIKGDSLVPREFILKEMQISSGDLYSEQKMNKSQERLFSSDLFNYVVIRAPRDSMKDNRIPVTVEVNELPSWSLEAGLGYGTEDRFRASLEITKLQFFGGTRKFIFEGKHSHFLPLSFEAKFIQPGLIRDNLDLIFNPFFIRENEVSYTADRLGTGVTFQQNISRSTSAYLMYSFERDFLKDRSVSASLNEERERELIHNKSGFTIGFNRNTANNRFNPTSGWKLNAYFTYTGIGFRSKYHYYKNEIGLVRYHQLDEDWILAGKIGAGFIQPTGDEKTPIEDRFLLGGASSLRGWGRHQISPVNEAGRPVGGNSMLEGSMELRFPIYDIFSGVTFVDFGNVWKTSFNYNPADFLYDLGFGLRVNTPVGPVRLDLATPLFEKPIRPQFFISIGHAF
ncbi:MAG: outer membrane protein assembly factor BamA [Bacteroidota bacterium]